VGVILLLLGAGTLSGCSKFNYRFSFPLLTPDKTNNIYFRPGVRRAPKYNAYYLNKIADEKIAEEKAKNASLDDAPPPMPYTMVRDPLGAEALPYEEDGSDTALNKRRSVAPIGLHQQKKKAALHSQGPQQIKHPSKFGPNNSGDLGEMQPPAMNEAELQHVPVVPVVTANVKSEARLKTNKGSMDHTQQLGKTIAPKAPAPMVSKHAAEKPHHALPQPKAVLPQSITPTTNKAPDPDLDILDMGLTDAR
jgi:hypothetical protein